MEIEVVEGDEEEVSPELMKLLEEELGEKPQRIKPAVPDEVLDQKQKVHISLYRCVGFTMLHVAAIDPAMV